VTRISTPKQRFSCNKTIAAFACLLFCSNCSSGEVHLTSFDTENDDGATNGLPRSGAADATGGTSAAVPESSKDLSPTTDDTTLPAPGESVDPTSPSAEPTPSKEPPLPPFSFQDLPCAAVGSCNCQSQPLGCATCEDFRDCNYRSPYCDEESSQCTECMEDSHCQERFGSRFTVCERGRCVECVNDSTCSRGATCIDNFCGTCDSTMPCVDGFTCFRGHCLAELIK